MKLSRSAEKLRALIEKAIQDQLITREEYDMILHLATKDGYVDKHEQALLEQLQEMIENKLVKFGPAGK
jgi:hypothetical protein